jgi:uncharacterized membrane protein
MRGSIMFSRKELKETAKLQLRGRWGNAILATFLIGLIIGVVSGVVSSIQSLGIFTPQLGIFTPGFGIFTVLLTAPLQIGLIIFFLAFVRNPQKQDIDKAFSGFNIYGKSLGIVLWTYLWTFLWTLLFIIPGIVKALAYSQSYYIIADNPNIKVTDALKISMKMTNGYKWDIFIMGLSFIGWALLAVLLCSIGFLWLTPYMKASYANMYLKLKELSLESGACTPEDFGTAAYN